MYVIYTHEYVIHLTWYIGTKGAGHVPVRRALPAANLKPISHERGTPVGDIEIATLQ